MVDSASSYTIIPNEIYENLFTDIELCDSDIIPGVIAPTIPVQRLGLVKPLAVGIRGQKPII